MTSYTISPQEAGQRLDAALALLLPGWGLRARRRACENGLALVNGKVKNSGYKVKNGDTLQAQAGLPENLPKNLPVDLSENLPNPQAPSAQPARPAQELQAHLVRVQAPFAALYKPAGLHSAHIIGSKQASLESALPALLPQYPQARLLNRLDNETSGLVMACLERGGDGERIWKIYSANGEIRKTYLLIAQSETALELFAPALPATHTASFMPDSAIYACAALNTQDRAITRVLPHAAPSSLRHTRFRIMRQITHTEALTLMPAHPETLPPFLYLMQAEILLGARHQIRAHAASQGFPLWGDTLYGASPLPINSFFLHHVKLEMPGFFAEYPAPWNMD